MIAIVTIGHAKFAFESAAKASKAIELFSGSMPVREHYTAGGYHYSPELEKCSILGVEMKLVDPRCILSRKPEEGEPLPPPASIRKARQHADRPKQLLIGGGR